MQHLLVMQKWEWKERATPVSTRSRDIYLEVGSKPEVYTEEHDKLLAECTMNWTLFVDGYGKDGKRIYDPVKGKTCHQCRQKTLGHRTTCSKCNLVQGQFCGDCLYTITRYGEHVLEANQNPDWVCPPCRGICNCSLCRQPKGWAPTGPLYRKITRLGYKSVVHYLFQTRRSQKDDGNDPTKTLLRSAPSVANDVPSVKDDLAKGIAQNLETDNGRNQSESDEMKDADMNAEDGHGAEQLGLVLHRKDETMVKVNAPQDNVFTDNLSSEVTDEQVNSSIHLGEKGIAAEHVGTDIGMEIAETEHKTYLETPVLENGLATETSKTDVGINGNVHLSFEGIFAHDSNDFINTPDKMSTRRRRQVIVAPSPDSIAGRLRLRRKGLFSV